MALQDSLSNLSTAVTDSANETDQAITEIQELAQKIRDGVDPDAVAAELDGLAASLEGKVGNLAQAITDANAPTPPPAP